MKKLEDRNKIDSQKNKRYLKNYKDAIFKSEILSIYLKKRFLMDDLYEPMN